MKYRYTAALTAVLLLFCMTGCKGKPNTIAVPEQTVVANDSAAEAAPGDVDFPIGTMHIEETETDSPATAPTAESAAAASIPAALEGELIPATLEQPTVEIRKQSDQPNAADDDQQGEYAPPPVTAAPPETKPDRPAATIRYEEPPVENSVTTPVQKTNDTPTALNTKGGAPDGKLQIIIETVEITLDQLKAQDYKVDLSVTLDKNPGIVFSEWGLQLDERCAYTADSTGLPFNTISFINEAKSFLWTSWSSGGNATTRSGKLLTLHVTVPRDAKSGSAYPVTYAPESLAPAPHLWENEDNTSYVASNQIGWTNGGILIK